jgi:hypothetical protein
MKVIANSCSVTEEGVYLRKITFDIASNVVDQVGNIIPMLSLKGGGVMITVNPRFVTSVVATYGKQSLRVNTPMCDEDDATYDFIYAPILDKGELKMSNIGIKPFTIQLNHTGFCPKGTDFTTSRILFEDLFWQTTQYIKGNYNSSNDGGDTIFLSNIKKPELCDSAGPETLTVKSLAGESIECIASLGSHLLVVTNHNNSKGSAYYSVPLFSTLNAPVYVLGASPQTKLLYSINTPWANTGFGINKIIWHGTKLYHFNSSNFEGDTRPLGVRILDIGSAGISGHKFASNSKNEFWPTNLISTKHGMVASNANIARIVEYYFEGSALKTNMIVLSNPWPVVIKNAVDFSINRKII